MRETAARWFIRMQNSEPDHPDRGRFEAWLMANSANATEYSAVADVWQSFNSTEQLQSLSSAMEIKRHFEKHVRHQKVKTIVTSLFTLFLFIGMGLLGYQSWQAQPVLQVAAITPVGEQGEQLLADGSKLIINANSDVQVVYYRNKRMVKLNRGEVIFEVAKDAKRPFIVDSGRARVTVLGTRFVVNRLNKLVRVSVANGSVRVETQSADGKTATNPIVLHNGEVAEVKGTASAVRIRRSAADAFNFRQGILNFDQAELDEIAETVSRYRKPEVTARLMQSHNPQITAVVKASDIESFLGSMPSIAAVKIKSSANQTLLIVQPQE